MIPQFIRQYTAKRRLQRLVDTAAQSPATVSYRMHRPAARRGAATRASRATQRAVAWLRFCREKFEEAQA